MTFPENFAQQRAAIADLFANTLKDSTLNEKQLKLLSDQFSFLSPLKISDLINITTNPESQNATNAQELKLTPIIENYCKTFLANNPMEGMQNSSAILFIKYDLLNSYFLVEEQEIEKICALSPREIYSIILKQLAEAKMQVEEEGINIEDLFIGYEHGGILGEAYGEAAALSGEDDGKEE